MPSNRPKYRISLDLGSDSTVAFVKRPDDNEYQQIDLQLFARAFVARPALVRDGRGRPLPRLRSRYAVNEGFRTPEPLKERVDAEYGYLEWLPEEHATQELVQFEEYLSLNPNLAEASMTGLSKDGHCLFKFFDDVTTPFALDQLLPNAKLAFQSSVSTNRTFRAQVESTGGTQAFIAEPAELIKNQVCLILENFVRHHPLLRDERNRPPAWEDCTVVLTVPNTYSPIHRDLLARMVGRTLGCEVRTITESDAIVFYYLVDNKPNVGLTPEELQQWSHQYLTIDIGKGTTDLTLMDVSYRVPPRRLKEMHDIPIEDNRPRQHVYVLARTGRASGGAKATFILAEFFESLVDRAVRQTTWLQQSPFRLTTTSRGIPKTTQLTTALLAFESVCERHKRAIEMTEEGVRFEPLADLEDAEQVAAFVAEQARHELERVPPKPPGAGGPPAPAPATPEAGMTGMREQVRAAVLAALSNPHTFRETDTEGKEELDRAWSELKQRVDAYVHENVDEVLVELAQAHLEGNEPVTIRDAVDALRSLVQEGSQRLANQSGEARDVRTHVIIAGQGSLFRPVRARLEQVFEKAKIGPIRQVSREREPVAAAQPSKAGGSLASRALAWLLPQGKPKDDPNMNTAVELPGTSLKDGCAYGALDWLLHEPIMVNPDHVHGQLAVDLDSGGECHWVDMDDLNEKGEYKVPIALPGPRVVYFLPARGERERHPSQLKADTMGRAYACEEMTIEVRPEDDRRVQLRVSTDRGDRIKLKETLFGAHALEHLRPLLWPAVLMEQP